MRMKTWVEDTSWRALNARLMKLGFILQALGGP